MKAERATKHDIDELVELRIAYLTEDGYPLYLSVGFKDDESKYHLMKLRP